jgi:hypothetical protein
MGSLPRPEAGVPALRIAASALLGGAGLGSMARDLLALGQPVVALAWAAGAGVAVLAGDRLR